MKDNKLKKSESLKFVNKRRERLIVIGGPTAVGKSQIALILAKILDSEIVVADSMQVYRGMDIGTDKPTAEERNLVRHHMIDIVDIKEEFNVATYQRMAREVVSNINTRNKIPILAGGTGLYIRAVIDKLEFPLETKPSSLREKWQAQDAEVLYQQLKRLDPDAAQRIDPKNKRRVIRALEVMALTGKPFSIFQREWLKRESIYDLLFFGLQLSRDKLYQKIEERVERMISSGLLQETQNLLAQGLENAPTASQALGYRQIIDYLQGRLSWEETVRLIKMRSRQYAKRQLTWFQADPRIRWIDLEKESPLKLICQEIQKRWGIECQM